MSDRAPLEQVDQDQFTAPRFRPYYSLLKFSRRLGGAATKQLMTARGALTKEYKLPSSQQLLGIDKPLNFRSTANANKESKASKDHKNLRRLVEQSHEVLAQATTIFPFKLFPDTVVVDRTKITIIKRNFFWSEDVVSIRIEDILNANTGVDLFFGSLNVSSRVMNSTDHYLIKFLWKQDAMHLKHIIQGYVIAQHNDINVAHLPRQELIDTLTELGNDTRSTHRS